MSAWATAQPAHCENYARIDPVNVQINVEGADDRGIVSVTAWWYNAETGGSESLSSADSTNWYASFSVPPGVGNLIGATIDVYDGWNVTRTSATAVVGCY
jgi:hypothetical protein